MERDAEPGVSALAVALANGDEDAAAELLRGVAGDDVIGTAAADPVMSALVVLVSGFASLVNNLGTEREGSAELWSSHLRDRLGAVDRGEETGLGDDNPPGREAV